MEEKLINNNVEDEEQQINTSESNDSQLDENNDSIEYISNYLQKRSSKFKIKINEISDSIIEQNRKLNKKYTNFKKAEKNWNKKIYYNCDCNDWCWDCCSDCFKSCACFFCCLKENDSERKREIEKQQVSINEKLKEIEYFEDYNSYNELNTQRKTSICDLFLLYFYSTLHFFALSEIHGILLALFKEIERNIKHYFTKKYDFDNGVIKNFHYFLTESNFHDSSQINFNYFTSFLTLYIIKSSKKKYIIEIIYIASILIIFLFSLLLISVDFLTEDQLKNNEDYNGYKLTFCLIIPYLIIYIFAGLISLLPNKILDEIFKKERVSTILWKLVLINLVIGVSVPAKNFFNYYFLINTKMKSSKILFNESITFISFSFVFFLYLFLTKYCCEKENKNNNNKIMKKKKRIN